MESLSHEVMVMVRACCQLKGVRVLFVEHFPCT